MKKGLEEIKHDERTYAIIISHTFGQPGVHFLTPQAFSQQVAYMNHPAGHIIQPHVHNRVAREIDYTQEVLLVRKGRLRVDFYDAGRKYLESRVVEAGDVILLAAGGHGFEVLEEIEMIEVKQGPYGGEADKTRFAGITAQEVRLSPTI